MEETLIVNTEKFQLTQMDFFIRLIVSTGIGFLIGLEREYASNPAKTEIFAGVRTFVFVVIFGYLSTLLSFFFTNWMILVALLATVVIVSLSYWVGSNKGKVGGTTAFATLIAFLLGCTTFLGFIEISLAVTVILLVFLSLKGTLHNFIRQITQEEIFALIKFVVIALLILPFLPDKELGPFEVINPREIGWVIILTSGIGFVGYLLMKFLGRDKGILLTGIVGGLVSSTVVAWVFSKKSKKIQGLSRHCAVAILAASTIMTIRVFVWVIIFKQALLPKLTIPLLLIFLAGFGIAYYFYKKQEPSSEMKTDFPLGEPLNLKEAFFFGFIYTGILLLVSYANSQFGTKGIYISSAIASLTDIDAITISISKLAGNAVPLLTAQNVILLATLCNTLVKIGISLSFGSNLLRKYILMGFGLMFLAGIMGFVIINS
ncbi:MgtC/SapB family protein [Limibacter armeniacum]|uniref:MgtC/SapB family protein n=1 Tax=Limibacter armeniacum TaxID=466084 RepID=UPI002FE53487